MSNAYYIGDDQQQQQQQQQEFINNSTQYVNTNGTTHLNSLSLTDIVAKNTNASKEVLDYIYLKLYEFEDFAYKTIDEKCKIIEQLERGLFAASQTDTNILNSSINDEIRVKDSLINELNQRINEYETEILTLKNTIKEQDDVILSHNNNLVELTNTKDTMMKSKDEAFKIQIEEINKKQKIIDDQQAMIESLKTKVENLEESFELNKIDLEKQLSDKEVDLNTKVETYVANLYYGHKYFEEILEEKDRFIKEKTNEINQLKLDFENKVNINDQNTEARLNQYINQLKDELSEKNLQIEQLKQHFDTELKQIMSNNTVNNTYDDYYRMLNAKINELNEDIETKNGVITKLKEELLNKEQIIIEKDKSVLVLQNQLTFSETKINDSKQSDNTVKKLKERFDIDIKNVKDIYEHQIELHKIKINMLEKSIENYQKCYNDLSKSSDALFNIETTSQTYKEIIDELQKTNVQLDTEKIEYQVKIKNLDEQIKQLQKEKENLNKKYTNADGERHRLQSERDAYTFQCQSQIQQKESELNVMVQVNNELNMKVCKLEQELMEFINLNNEYNQVKQQYQELIVNYEQISKQLVDTYSAIELINGDFNKAKQRIVELEQTIDELNIKCEHLENENVRINRENIRLGLNNSELSEKFELKCKELVDLNIYKQELADVNELTEQNKRLNSEINDKNELIEQLNIAKDYLETTNSQLLLKNIKMQLFIENMGYSIEQVDKSTIVKEYDEVREENERLKNDVVALNNKINGEINNKMRQFEVDNDELKVKINELREKESELLNVVDNYKKINETLEKKVNDLQKTIEKNSSISTNKEDAQSGEDLVELRNELVNLGNDLTIYMLNSNIKVDNLEKKLSEKSRDFNELTKLLSEKDVELKRLNNVIVQFNNGDQNKIEFESKQSEMNASKVENCGNCAQVEVLLNNKISEIGLLQEQNHYYYGLLSAYETELNTKRYEIECLQYQMSLNSQNKAQQENVTQDQVQQQQQQQQQSQVQSGVVQSEQEIPMINWSNYNQWSPFEQLQQRQISENIDYYKHECDTLRASLDEKLSIIDNLNEQINKLKINIDKHVDVNRQLNEEKLNLTEQIEKFKTTTEEPTNKFDPNDWFNNDWTDASQQKQNKIDSLELEIVKLKEQLNKYEEGKGDGQEFDSEMRELKQKYDIECQNRRLIEKAYEDLKNDNQQNQEYRLVVARINEFLNSYLATNDRNDDALNLIKINANLDLVRQQIEAENIQNAQKIQFYEDKCRTLEDTTARPTEIPENSENSNRFESLKDELNEKSEALQLLQTKYDSELSKLNEELNEQRKQYETLKKKAQKLKEKNKQLEGIKECQNDVEKVEKIENVQPLQANPESSDGHGSASVIESTTSEDSLNALQNELNTVKADNERIKKELKHAVDELKSSKPKSEGLNAENENIKKKYESLKIKAHMLKEKLKRHGDHSNIGDDIEPISQAAISSVEIAELERKINELRQDKEKTIEDFNRIYEENSRLCQELDDANTFIDLNQEKIDKLESNEKQLMAELEEARKSLEGSSQDNLSVVGQMIDDLKAENERIKADLETKENELKRISGEYNELDVKYKEIQSEFEALKKKYDTLKQKAQGLKGKLKKKDEQSSQHAEESSIITSSEQHEVDATKIVEYENKIKQLEAEREKAIENFNSIYEENGKLKQQLEDANELILSKRETNENVEDSEQRIKVQLEKTNRANEVEQESAVETLTSESNSQMIDELKSEIDKLKRNLESNESETKNTTDRYNELEVKYKEAQNELETLKKKYETLRQKAQGLKGKLKKTNEQASQHAEESTVAAEHHEVEDSKLVEYENKIKQLEVEREKVMENFTIIYDENSRLRQELDDANDVISSNKETIEKLEDNQKQLKNELEQINSKASESNAGNDIQSVESNNQLMDELRSEIDKLKSNLESNDSELKITIERYNELDQKFKENQSELDTLKKKYETLKQKAQGLKGKLKKQEEHAQNTEESTTEHHVEDEKLVEYENKIKQLTVERDNAVENFSRVYEENSRIVQELDDIKQQQEFNKQFIEQLENNENMTNSNIEDANKTIEQLKELICNKDNEIFKLNEMINNYRLEIENLRIIEKDEISNSDGKIADLEKRLYECQLVIEEKDGLITDYMSKDIEFQEKINDLEFHLSEANRKLNEKSSEISSIEARYENTISRLNEELIEQRKQYEILKKKAVKLKEKAKLLESSKHSSKESLHEAEKVEKMHLLEANPDRQHHESTITTVESNNERVNEVQNELNSVKADNERVKYELEYSNSELKRVSDELNDKIDELNRIRVENESSKNELTLTQTELKRVFDEYNAINLKHEELLAENETLKKKYETLRVKAHALKGKLKKSDNDQQQQQPQQEEEHHDQETNNKVAELEVKLKDLVDKESLLSDEILRLKEEVLFKDENLNELNSRLSKSIESNEELLAECSRLKEVLNSLENKQNTNESSEVIEELRTYKSLFEELRSENEQNKEYMRQVEDSLQKELLEKDNLKKEYEKLQQKALKLKALVKHSKSNQAKVIDESRSVESSSPLPVVEEHQQQLKSELNQSYTISNASASSIDSDTTELQRKLDELREENSRLKHEMNEITHLKNEIEKLHNEIKLETDVYNGKISQLHSDLDKEKCEKEELRNEFNKLQEKTTKLMAKLKQKKKTSEIVSNTAADTEHKQEVVKVCTAVASAAEVGEFESRINDDELNKRLLELSDENTHLKALINSLEERNREFSDEKNDEIIDLQDINQKLEVRVAENGERIKELELEIESLNEKLANNRGNYGDDEANSLRRNIEQLERSLEEANTMQIDEFDAANAKEMKYRELIDEKEQEILRLRNEVDCLISKIEQFSGEKKETQENSIINEVKREEISQLESNLEKLDDKNKTESNDWFTNDWNDVEKNEENVEELKMEVERLEKLLEEANKEKNENEVNMLRKAIQDSQVEHNEIVEAKENEILQLNNEVDRMRKIIDELNIDGKESGGDNNGSGFSMMELEEIVREKDAQIGQLKMEIGDMKKEKIEKDNCDNEWIQVDSVSDEITRENEELKRKLENLTFEISELVKVKDAEIGNLQSEIDNFKQAATTNTTTENAKSEIKLEESDQNDVVQSELERLKLLESNYELIINENNYLKDSLANIQQQANEMLYARDVQIAQLCQDNENMKQSITNQNLLNSGGNIEKVEHVQTLTQSNTDQIENNSNNEAISQLEAKLVELNSFIDNLKTENANLNDNISQLNTKINEFSTNGDNNVAKLNEEIVKLRVFESSYATIQVENNYLKESLESIQQQANQMLYERDLKINEFVATIEKYKQNEDELIKNKNELIELLSNKDSEIVVLKETQNNEKERYTQQLSNDTTMKISQLEEEILNLKSTNSQYINEIEFKTDKIVELEGYINELKDKLNKNELEISDLKEKLNQAHANIDNESIEKMNLIKNIDFMKNEIDKLRENEIKLTNEIDTLKPSTTTQQHTSKMKSSISNDQMIELTKNSIKESLENVQYQLNNKCCSHLEDQLNNCRLICDKVINKLDQLKSQNTSVNERIKSIESLIIESSSTITTSPSTPTTHLNEENA